MIARTLRRTAPRFLASAMLVASLVFIASCDCETGKLPETGAKNTQQPSTTPAPETSKPDAVYVVRGKVTEVPDPKNLASEFRVEHEAIDDFKGSDGIVSGMNSMEMHFPLKDDALAAGLAVGDIIELTFEDYYKPRRKYFVVKIVKLPADTKLEFREAKPPTAPAPAENK